MVLIKVLERKKCLNKPYYNNTECDSYINGLMTSFYNTELIILNCKTNGHNTAKIRKCVPNIYNFKIWKMKKK